MEEEIKLEELLGTNSPGFIYIRTYLQEAIMDPSEEIRRNAIKHLRDIGEHLPVKLQIVGGSEKYRKLYLRIKMPVGDIQEIYVSKIPPKYQDTSKNDFTINGD